MFCSVSSCFKEKLDLMNEIQSLLNRNDLLVKLDEVDFASCESVVASHVLITTFFAEARRREDLFNQKLSELAPHHFVGREVLGGRMEALGLLLNDQYIYVLFSSKKSMALQKLFAKIQLLKNFQIILRRYIKGSSNHRNDILHL